MDSKNSQKITELASNNVEPLIPNLPFVPSSDSISTPRASRRPQVPLSRFESLPTEIHIAIIEAMSQVHTTRDSYYDGLCKLARASPVLASIAQRRMYHFVSLDTESMALQWLESDATIRGEFTTQVLVLGGEDDQTIGSEMVERVLASQSSALRELVLYHAEGVELSSLDRFSGQLLALFRLANADEPFSDLRELGLVSCDVNTTIDSAAKPTFQLELLYINNTTLPVSFLRDIMTASSASLRYLQLMDLGDDFDWTSTISASFVQLQELWLFAPHIPSLLALFSGCGNLTYLNLHREKGRSTLAIADSTNRFSQLSKELASLPKPTLKTCTLLLRYVGRSGGAVTLQEVEELIAISSLANLERLEVYVPKDWAASDIEALKKNKGKKGELTIKVHSW